MTSTCNFIYFLTFAHAENLLYNYFLSKRDRRSLQIEVQTALDYICKQLEVSDFAIYISALINIVIMQAYAVLSTHSCNC